MYFRQYFILLILPCFFFLSTGFQTAKMMSGNTLNNIVSEEEHESNEEPTEDTTLSYILFVTEELGLTEHLSYKTDYINHFDNKIGVFYKPNAFSPPEFN